METMTLEQFKAALTKAANARGKDGVAVQKALILRKYTIVDADGIVIDPETVDVEIREKSAEPTEGDPGDEATVIAKAIKQALAPELSAITKAVGRGNDVKVLDAPWQKSLKYGKFKSFENDGSGRERCYRFGQFALAVAGRAKSFDWCRANGILVEKSLHAEGVNSAGGYLVPVEFEPELIKLREQYGVARRNCRVYPMGSETKELNKKTAFIQAYFPGEGKAITKSKGTYDKPKLVARKVAALAEVTSELNEDSILDVGDDIMDDISWAFAFKEDQCAFIGDGTSTYGGIVGLDATLTNSTYQLSDGGATTYAAVTAAEIATAMAKLPEWAEARGNVKFFCPKAVWHGVFERLIMAAGGNTARDIASGAPRSYFGYPVEVVQAMTTTQSGGATFAYFGDMRLAVAFGDRRQTTIRMSDEAGDSFENDTMLIRGTERFDINCVNCGDAAASGALIKLTL